MTVVDRVLVPGEVESLTPFVVAGVFGSAEVHTAALVARATGADHHVALATALAVWAPAHGHTCVDLATVGDVVARELAAAERPGRSDRPADRQPPNPLSWPDVADWSTSLRASPAVRSVDRIDEVPVLDERPLVLRGRRVWTQRQWVDECSVAQAVRQRVDASGPVVAPDHDDRQLLAVERARDGDLTVIVGGPGTGKTYTVARLLAALAAAAPDRPLNVGLAAPTGKAAARMTQAVRSAGDELGVDALADVRAVTLHRLLGPRHTRTRFRHDAASPLPYDMVVVDELSMVAMPMMARLLEAAGPETKLVVVGDPDQLESIEAGSVLGDLVAASKIPGSPLADRVVRLDQPRRTTGESPIFSLAEAIRTQRVDEVVDRLRAGAVDDDGEPVLVFHDEGGALGAPQSAVGATVRDAVRDVVGPGLFALQEAALAGADRRALDALESQRLLCGHARGPYGVASWNDLMETWMLGAPARRDHPGRPVLVTRNDIRHGIANGDTGVIVPTGGDGRAGWDVAFRGPESGTESGGGVRRLGRSQLEHLDLAYALTVHKSQGSEYDTVVFVHPPTGSPLIGRELLYTAVTRARRRLVVVATPDAIAEAVRTPSRRLTGLVEALDFDPASK